MRHFLKKPTQMIKLSFGIASTTVLLASSSVSAAPNDVIHAFYADEHNDTTTVPVGPLPGGDPTERCAPGLTYCGIATSPAQCSHQIFLDEPTIVHCPAGHLGTTTQPTGNRILEIDIENMELVNSLDVPGIAGHHADNGYKSKIYGVPKNSGFVNVIDLRKDQNGTTSMERTKQINLIHKPRSGDAYNKKFNVILMAAKNRPMGSFINVDTDEVVGTIGENVDCKLTDGSRLLDHADANTIAGATKYQCSFKDNGGDQISGHPYWLTADYAAIVDRTNRQISVYRVWEENDKIKSQLVNHLKTRTSIHQIVPRDRTSLPGSQQADFYAIEEGNKGGPDAYGVAPALLKLKLTTNGLKIVDRIDLARTQDTSFYNANRLYANCQAIHRADYSPSVRFRKFKNLFWWSGLSSYKDQNENIQFPVECISAKLSGGHNADFAPDNKRIYIGNAAGYMHIVNVDSWKIENTVDTGGLLLDKQSGSGHTCFAGNRDLAIVTNHKASYATVINLATQRKVKNIQLPFSKENIFSAYQSHTCYIDKEQDYYYNFWTDGGVFYKISLNDLNIADSLYTGGIPIQGNYISLGNIMSTTPVVVFAAVNDDARSDGNAITIDVLANDTGDNIVLEEVDPASHGQAKIVSGQIVYTPNLGFSGEDSFWYGISSSAGNSWEWALITVTVESTVQPAELKAFTDEVTVSSGAEITIDVLSNDTGTNLSIGWVDDASNGTISIVNNKLVYTSNPSFTGTEDFWYELVNSTGESTWGNVIITVGDSNASTVMANADSVTLKVGETVTIDALANDAGRELTLFEVDPTWTGSISVDNNKLVYTAADSFTGSIEVWYGIEDATGKTDWGKVTITITD